MLPGIRAARYAPGGLSRLFGLLPCCAYFLQKCVKYVLTEPASYPKILLYVYIRTSVSGFNETDPEYTG